MIHSGEKRRRENLVQSLEGREKQLRLVFQQQQSANKGQKEGDDRKKLLDSGVVDLGIDNSWGNREEEPLLGAAGGSGDLLNSYHQKREQVLAEQDKGLDALHDIIVNQKHLSENIYQETVAHHDLIDDIEVGMERTHHGITTTTQNVRLVSRRETVWKYWLVIFLLAIVIIIVIATPGK